VAVPIEEEEWFCTTQVNVLPENGRAKTEKYMILKFFLKNYVHWLVEIVEIELY